MRRNIARVGALLAAMVMIVAGSVAFAGSANANVQDTAYHSIKNNTWGQCAGVAASTVGSHVLLGGCDDLPGHNWVKIPTGQTNTFYFVNEWGGYCLTAGSTTAGQVITVDVCNALPTQTWVQLPDNKLLHFGTGLCLDTVSAGGSELMQWFCGQEAPAGVQSWAI